MEIRREIDALPKAASDHRFPVRQDNDFKALFEAIEREQEMRGTL